MPQLEWNRSLALGIGPLDKDHREFVVALAALESAVEGGSDSRETLPLLHHLDSHTRAHFIAEESLMTTTRYPGAQLHAIKHEQLLKQLHAFVARAERCPAALDRHSLKFLRDWATIHIQSDDRNFGLWLNEHGKR
jgi:hemerythrin-like metal-binding protein